MKQEEKKEKSKVKGQPHKLNFSRARGDKYSKKDVPLIEPSFLDNVSLLDLRVCMTMDSKTGPVPGSERLAVYVKSIDNLIILNGDGTGISLAEDADNEINIIYDNVTEMLDEDASTHRHNLDLGEFQPPTGDRTSMAHFGRYDLIQHIKIADPERKAQFESACRKLIGQGADGVGISKKEIREAVSEKVAKQGDIGARLKNLVFGPDKEQSREVLKQYKKQGSKFLEGFRLTYQDVFETANGMREYGDKWIEEEKQKQKQTQKKSEIHAPKLLKKSSQEVTRQESNNHLTK